MMKAEDFQKITQIIAEEITDRFYPKNDTAARGGEPTRGRGECMRDLGLFLAALRAALTEAGVIAPDGEASDETAENSRQHG